MSIENDGPAAGDDLSFSSAFTDAVANNSSPLGSPPPSTPSNPATPPSEPTAPPTPPASSISPPPVATPPIAPAPVAPPSNPLFDTARQFGFNQENATPEQLAAWFTQQFQTLQPMAQFGQQVAPFQQQFGAFLAAQQPPPAEPAAPDETAFDLDKYFSERWKVPEIDPAVMHMENIGALELDKATGLYQAAPGCEMQAAPYLQSINEYERARREQLSSLFEGNVPKNIYEFVKEPLMQEMQKLVTEHFAAQMGEASEKQQIQSYEQANAAWLYQQTAFGQELSPQGKTFVDSMTTLRAAGLNDQSLLLKTAELMAGVNRQQPTPPAPAQVLPGTAPAQPQQVPLNPQQADLQRKQSFMDNALQKGLHSPDAGGALAHTPDSFNVAGESELSNMFTNALRSTMGKP